MEKNIFMGNAPIHSRKYPIYGEFIDLKGESWYKIHNYHQMPDFLISIVSDSDYWMYISSNGSLTAGRKNRDNVLFPYYTEDKIHDYRGKTGSASFFLVEKNGKTFLWEPFSDESRDIYPITRNIYKSIYGNKIIFEEINASLEMTFRYGWYNSEKYGFVKKSILENQGNTPVQVEILDGLRNIMPNDVQYAFQNEYSNLADAYKKNELVENTTLGLFMLSSIPVDRPEPSESLKSTTVWSIGPVPKPRVLLSDRQLSLFKKGLSVETEKDIRGARGAYYINASLELGGNQLSTWIFAAQINQDSCDVANLVHSLKTGKDILQKVDHSIEEGTRKLENLVARADGLQKSSDELNNARHFSNTLFNIMRGGIYVNDYTIITRDFKAFAEHTCPASYPAFGAFLSALPPEMNFTELTAHCRKSGNRDLERIAHEYLPLIFSRRHGDPSRPWNQFSIDTRNPDGSMKINFEGNWRDIFQNWEALNLSFPGYIEPMIVKFLNASTADGYNPYRITRNGIDWEVPNPNEPWSHIGYWGDHQVIYLQKFLEQSMAYHPGKLEDLLTREIFVYANVPYRIKSYKELVKDPRETIDFDADLNKEIDALVKEKGADGRLLRHTGGEVCYANMAEKILVTSLVKLSNFIPEAGIWLNTQRPEWNDANNALVGNGTSMVTLYYLRRSLDFWNRFFKQLKLENVPVAEEVADFYHSVLLTLKKHSGILQTGFSAKQREQFTNEMGTAGSVYRETIYARSFSGKKKNIPLNSLIELCSLAVSYIDQTIAKNRRDDGMYHAYNLISFTKEGIVIRYLYEMLEGQVAVLSSGYLSPAESLEVLAVLKSSKLFREDQHSYILYPDRHLPRFDEKNNIPREFAEQSSLFQALLQKGDTTIIRKDEQGNCHFHASFRNAGLLRAALERLDPGTYGEMLVKEKETILETYEKMFDHQSFTGRSGTFFAYEGLGSIYWHMVSKLLLATQECYNRAVKEKADAAITGKLKDHYYEIKAGIGLHKNPELYGAFPTDAYSHTPAHAGAKQPGLTGQVKEDVISRFGELGVHVENGEIHFDGSLMNKDELHTKPSVFSYIDIEGNWQELELKTGQMAFTVCQVPVVMTKGEKAKVTVVFKDGKVLEAEGNGIGREVSDGIFGRNGGVRKVEVEICSVLRGHRFIHHVCHAKPLGGVLFQILYRQ